MRKSSTGSGSGSTERTSEEQPPSEVMLTSPGGSTSGTVIKPDPGFVSDCSISTRGKMLSGESDTTYRGSSSHESLEGDPHQITLVSRTLSDTSFEKILQTYVICNKN